MECIPCRHLVTCRGSRQGEWSQVSAFSENPSSKSNLHFSCRCPDSKIPKCTRALRATVEAGLPCLHRFVRCVLPTWQCRIFGSEHVQLKSESQHLNSTVSTPSSHQPYRRVTLSSKASAQMPTIDTRFIGGQSFSQSFTESRTAQPVDQH